MKKSDSRKNADARGGGAAERETGASHSVSRGEWLVGLAVLVALVFAVFWPALSGGFVWDDRLNLVENEHVQGFSLENVRWAFTHALAGHYQPLTLVSYMVDHAIGGLEPRIYHVTNVAWHAFDTVLFAILAWQLLRAAAPASDTSLSRSQFVGALAAAAVFGLHPLRVESVAWVTDRRSVLCGAFFLLALLAYLRAVRSPASGSLHVGWYCTALLLFTLSLLSKALVVALPIVLLIIDVYPLRRHERIGWTRLVVEKLPFVACTITSGVIALNASAQSGALEGLQAHGWPSRIAQIFYGIAFYPRAMLAAADWYPLYERPAVLDPWEKRFVLSALATVAITIAAVALRKRFPALLAVWISYVALLAPVSGIAQSGPQLVADRYSYLSCLGFALLAGWGVSRWWRHTGPGDLGRVVCIGLSFLVLAYWSARTWRQTRVWRDDASIWARVLELGPTALALNNAGDGANRRGDRAKAIDAFASSLALAPQYEYARANLVEGLIAEDPSVDRAVLEKSAKALRRSLEVLRPDDAGAWYALGLARTSLQDLDEAGKAFERATKAKPDSSPAWSKLGLVRYLRGDRTGSASAYRRAVELDPDNLDAWLGIGIAAVEVGDAASGVEAFTQATRLAPENALAWTGLGTSLWLRGEAEPAATALERALTLDPSNARAASTLEQVRAGKR